MHYKPRPVKQFGIKEATDGQLKKCITLVNQQPASTRRICGQRNILELRGDDHKRMKVALVSFLKPEVLKHYVVKIDEEIRKHLELHWHGKKKVQNDETSDATDEDTDFQCNLLPYVEYLTRFNRSLKANAKVKSIIMDLIKEERAALKQNGTSPNQDLITCLLSWSGFWLKIHPSMELVFMSRTYGEPVTWEDLMKMKYTWRVTTETLRITPPVLFL
ncbi:hypothetical protein LguiB_034196 [Lonicera macranthoides]